MRPLEVIQAFKDAGALLDGHFEYASGRHGNRFLQASRVLQHPPLTERLCKALAQTFATESVDLVVGPATGGIILAYETARHLECPAVFTEKDGQGGMVLKRGFSLAKGCRVLIVEDIITTGGTVKKSIVHLIGRGAEVIGIGALIDRSAGGAEFSQPFKALATLDMDSWPSDSCPLCAEGTPLTEPDDLIV